MFYCINTQEPTKTNHVEFGITDDKGRKVGCVSYCIERELYVNPNCTIGFSDERVTETGTYWFVRVQLTKDDRPFGATQMCQVFGDFNDVHPYIVKRITDSENRQAKKWGRDEV